MASRQTHPIRTPFRSGQAVRIALLRARSLDRSGRNGGGRPRLIGELGGDVLVVFASILVPWGPSSHDDARHPDLYAQVDETVD
jgi:hypothetical protein